LGGFFFGLALHELTARRDGCVLRPLELRLGLSPPGHQRVRIHQHHHLSGRDEIAFPVSCSNPVMVMLTMKHYRRASVDLR
jgi:hypothetical protein